MSETEELSWDAIEVYRNELIDDAMRVLGSRQDAEDVVQETFCEILKTPSRLADAGSPRALLLSINRCNAVDRARHKKRDSERMIRKFQQEPARTETTGGFSSLERTDFITSAIENLPARMRAVVVLHYFKHMSYKQISEKLKMPAGTVGRLLFEASKALYSKLEIHLDKPPADPPPKRSGRSGIQAAVQPTPPTLPAQENTEGSTS